MSTLTLTIPPGLWLSSNRPIRNHAHKARVVRDIRTLVELEATAQGLLPVDGPVAVDWTIRYPKGVRRDKGDPANAHPVCKATLDALVKGGWIEDDGPLHVVSETYRRGDNLDVPAVHQVVLVLATVT